MKRRNCSVLLDKAYKFAYINGWPNLAEYIRTAIPSEDIPTMATDGWDIFYNPEFLKKLTIQEAVAVFMHEYYHIIYDHVQRRGTRNPLAWNLAADVVVNDAVLSRCGFLLPTEAVFRGHGIFKDLPHDLRTTVKIYDWIKANAQNASDEEKEQADAHPDKENNQPTREQESKKNRGKLQDKSEEMKEVLYGRQESDWMDLLKAMQIESGRLVHRTHKRSFRKPARYEPNGLIRPCYNKYQHHPKVDVYIDVSGSMGDYPLQIFSGLKQILSAMRIYRPRFFSFNCDIREIDMNSEKFSIGGGTDIKKVLDKINSDKADLAILITDCEDSVKKSDFKENVVVVSNNYEFGDYVTTSWDKVKKNDKTKSR